MKTGVGVLVLLGALVAARPAVAEPLSPPSVAPDRADDDPTFRRVSPQRRNGLVLGASGGLGMGAGSGYPNSARFQDDPDFYSESPLLVGWSSSYFVMGALNDYVSFGPMFSLSQFESAEWKSTGWSGGFRAEIFPLVTLVPTLADTSFYVQLGVGGATLRAKGPYPNSDGTQSFFGLGVHHEWRLGRLFGGHAAAGPYVEYDAIRSPSTERHWLSFGVRVAWYGAKVELDAR